MLKFQASEADIDRVAKMGAVVDMGKEHDRADSSTPSDNECEMWDGYQNVVQSLPALGHAPEGKTYDEISIDELTPPSDEELRSGFGDEGWADFVELRAQLT